MNEPTAAVICAVGLDGAPAAIEYAAREALVAGAPLHIVHVLRVPAVEAYSGVYGGLLEDADAAIKQAVEQARTLTENQVRVSCERVDDGAMVNHLAHRADSGRLIVLQHRHLGRGRRLVTGSTVAAVASRTMVPVVSVPEGWTRSDQPPCVTVGVQDGTEAAALLHAGFEEAKLRQARLVAVHSWWLETDWEPASIDQGYKADRESSTRRELQPVIDHLRKDFPEVDASLEIWNAPPADALLDASRTAELLVVGRRHHLLPLGSHLGPVSRSILAHAECPVFLIPEPVRGRRVTPQVRGSNVSGVMY